MTDGSRETTTLGDLPDPDDREAVKQFEQSFNGYEHFGTLKKTVDEAKARRKETLPDLRDELFFMYRAENHTGSTDRHFETYRALYPHFRRLLPGNG